ncbi:MAG: hypothetical protein IIZ39_05560 [Blautia sp.]|nr:hypothetical protein [Blautia sp.]
MLAYYSYNCILSWAGLGILCILVWENEWISKKDKKVFYVTYALIALSLFAEWVSVSLGGRVGYPKEVLIVAKCFDYILSPLIGAALVAQMQLRNYISKIITAVLVFNTAFQVVSAGKGWMIQVDENLYYTRGPLFRIYLGVCVVMAVLVTMQWIAFGRAFHKHHRVSLYATLGLFYYPLSCRRAPLIEAARCIMA